MLLDDEELQIMASAAQPHLRSSQGDYQARCAFDDFIAARPLAGARVLELGPGQHDFARFAAAAGATVVSIDHDPAVVALGRKRGHEAVLADVMTFDWNSMRGEFDGLFARSSTAPQWFRAPALLEAFVDSICSVLKPDGWGWVLPWNRYLNTPPDHVEMMLAAQERAYQRNGFNLCDLRPLAAALFGPNPDNYQLFIKGLDPPEEPDPRRIVG
jgi:SAM-dependent methyltransferase